MPQKNRFIRYIMAISVIHAILLILITFILNNQTYIFWEEPAITRLSTVFKKFVLGIDPKPSKNEFIFVNNGYDIETIDVLDQDEFPLGKQVITDRAVLGRFFKILNDNPTYKFIICDTYFDLPTDKDSLLGAELKRAKRLLIGNYLTADTILSSSVFEAPSGLVDFLAIEGDDFLKYKVIFNDSLKTIPLLMQEALSGESYTGGSYFYKKKNEFAYYLNNFVLDFRIRPYDLQESEEKYLLVNLGQGLLQLKDSDIQELVKGRIIVIGDFVNRDVHNTILGQMPGPLILTNAFLALKAEDNKITVLYLLFLFTGFFVLSMFVFSPTDKLRNFLQKVFPNYHTIQWILSYLTYATYLTMMALLSYIFFHIQMSILFLSIYAKLVDWAVESKFYRQIKADSKQSV